MGTEDPFTPRGLADVPNPIIDPLTDSVDPEIPVRPEALPKKLPPIKAPAVTVDAPTVDA